MADIFISYAHIDNQPFSGEEKGWITHFVNNLRKEVPRKLGRPEYCEIWMDFKLAGADRVTPEIEAQLRAAHTIILFISKGWLASEWCQRELEYFCEQHQAQLAGHIFMVEIDAIDKQNEAPAILHELLGYPFWERDDHDKQRRLGWPAPLKSDKGYYERLADLSDRLAAALAKQHKTTAARAAAPASAVVKASIYAAPANDSQIETIGAQPVAATKPVTLGTDDAPAATPPLANNIDLSAIMDNEQLQDDDEAASVTLASNPSLSEAEQAELARTGLPSVREALAGNANLAEKQQHYLATTGSVQVKCQLAKNTSIVKAVQALLADDEEMNVRAALASNTALDEACQITLMDHPENYKLLLGPWHAVVVLAANAALTAELMQRIAATCASNNPVLLAGLARNPSLTETLMKKFANYEDRQPAPNGGWFVGAGWMVRAGLAINSALPESLQTQLSKDERSEVRASLACNLSLIEPLQARLAEDRDENVQNQLAGNPSLTVAQQAQLASTGNVDIRLALMDNPVLDERIKGRIIASITEHDLWCIEKEVEYASDRLDRLSLEDNVAQKKSCDASLMIDIPFFNSAAKKERLEAEANRTSEQCSKATSEYFSLVNKLGKIRELISLQ